jgi:iron complex transport system ATP-binding protein
MKIEVVGATLTHPGASRRALDGVSFRVEPGTLFAILGPNGSGKSTLTRAILGASHLDSGEVLLDDRPLSDWKRRELATRVGAVAQSEPLPFPMTVGELVGMGRYAHLGPLEAPSSKDREAVEAALERCDVLDLSDRLVQTLSGGELQRVRIARALAQQPEALILDEPTASLDIRHEMGIMELLHGSAQCGITIVLVTHHLDLASRFAGRMLLMDQGRVAAEGDPRDVMNAATLGEVYGWPVIVEEDRVTGSPRVVPGRDSG